MQQRDLPKTYNPYTPAELQAFAPDSRGLSFCAAPGSSASSGSSYRAERLPEARADLRRHQPRYPARLGRLHDTLIRPRLTWTAASPTRASSSATRCCSASRSDRRAGRRACRPCRAATVWPAALLLRHDGLGGGRALQRAIFPAPTKASIEALVADLMAAYHARIEHLDWMGPETRAEALHKLDTYVIKVGYPDKQRDYSQRRRPRRRPGRQRAARRRGGLAVPRRPERRPVDIGDWSMTPQTNDAYNGSLRDIVFPAGDPAAADLRHQRRPGRQLRQPSAPSSATS